MASGYLGSGTKCTRTSSSGTAFPSPVQGPPRKSKRKWLGKRELGGSKAGVWGGCSFCADLSTDLSLSPVPQGPFSLWKPPRQGPGLEMPLRHSFYLSCPCCKNQPPSSKAAHFFSCSCVKKGTLSTAPGCIRSGGWVSQPLAPNSQPCSI